MMKCPAAIDAPATPEYANGTYANGEANQERNCTKRPTNVPNNTPGPRNRPLSISFPRSHQRRYSADFCRSSHSPVITVKKNLKEPDRPQCVVSLLTPQSVPRNPSKRYSCPPFAVFSTKTRPFASSSSSSSPPSSNSSSCSSPPPAVQTSVITGHDPLGWKLRPKSSSSSPRANRLSLQIPLPTSSATKTNPETPLRFLRLPQKSHPFVTLEELRDVHLAPVLARHESDDVFSDGGEEEEEEEVKATGKEPPPVPEKTVMARQIAQLMARSHQRKEIIYSRVIKTKRENSHETEDTSRMIVQKLSKGVTVSVDIEITCCVSGGLRDDTSCSGRRSRAEEREEEKSLKNGYDYFVIGCRIADQLVRSDQRQFKVMFGQTTASKYQKKILKDRRFDRSLEAAALKPDLLAQSQQQRHRSQDCFSLADEKALFIEAATPLKHT
ncbi:hypothetical protein F7725_013915 [Dissostichus mawsoni]|uniref:Uncharacterized protein n=1 Tax=Dissostichus mawsoni TaxID=36200 RepID=A0A7J5YXK4_DISMA|nr:hypothetical protein F7725_013915 [Dissostichus mawsoni]